MQKIIYNTLKKENLNIPIVITSQVEKAILTVHQMREARNKIVISFLIREFKAPILLATFKKGQVINENKMNIDRELLGITPKGTDVFIVLVIKI
jgi:hypothetical protein